MALTLTLSDADIPASETFVDFVYSLLSGEAPAEMSIPPQVREKWGRNSTELKKFQDEIKRKSNYIAQHDVGNHLVVRAYTLFKEMLTGNRHNLKQLDRFHFFFIVGMPRTGGTYFTKQMFTAAGLEFNKIRKSLSHDGYPNLTQVSFRNKNNIHTNGLLQLAEFITMVEVFYGKWGKVKFNGRIVVPKKMPKAVYDFPLIKNLFGENSSYFITIRHPLPIIQSVLNRKGGKLPEHGKFETDDVIERWAFKNWIDQGLTRDEILEMDYIETFLGYWKKYYCQMALSDLPLMPGAKIIPFTKEDMEATVQEVFDTLGNEEEVEEFKVSKFPDFGKEYEDKAEKVVKEVGAFWKSLGMDFPVEKLLNY
ncbi:MAG: hypothetical protein ACTSXQ_06595 [Alphaproteobacteria bacterium]